MNDLKGWPLATANVTNESRKPFVVLSLRLRSFHANFKYVSASVASCRFAYRFCNKRHQEASVTITS